MKAKLNNKNNIPLHRHIRETLRQEIIQGLRAPYSEIPSEQELADAFKTTRMTVRQAIAALEHEGLIEKSQGRRTIVCPPKEIEPIFALPHDNQSFFRSGTITYKLIKQDWVTPPKMVREKLQLPWTVEKVILISRIRLLHDKPISYYETYFPKGIIDNILKEDLTDRSLVYTVRHDYALTPTQMLHDLEVLSADEEIAELLSVRESSKILLVESIEFDDNNIPYSYNIEKFRADRYRFQIRMSHP